MPPKKATTTSTKAAAKANTSSKRKSAVPDEKPERVSKRAKTQPETLEQTEAKRQTPAATKQAPSTKKITTEAAKNSSAAKKKAEPAKNTTKPDAKPANKPGRPAKKATPADDAKPAKKTAKKPGRPAKTATSAEDAPVADAEEPSTKKATKGPGRPKLEPKSRLPAKPKPALPKINQAPQELLEVLICGQGENGELGLGSAKGQTGVKRPRLNPLLSVKDQGVVQVACGGMHALALTHDNKILTWGVNDQCTLGRDTKWEGGLRDVDAGSDDDDSDDGDTGLNPRESTPTAVDTSFVPAGTIWTQVAAGDSCSFAVTDEGLVYGWGTFRANEGIIGFSPTARVQPTPVHVPELKNIKFLACGANHVLALDNSGNVFAWGAGQQMQLGRKPVERTRLAGLTPRPLGLPKGSIVQIACGAYHAFAIDNKDNVWAWGLNNFGECALSTGAGESEATVNKPTKISELCGKGVTCIKGGEHHSIAVNGSGDCLVWGRGDGGQLGIDISKMEDDAVIKDESGRTRIVIKPTVVPQIQGRTKLVTACSDHSLAVTTDGQAWSWGFSALYQTGQGTDDDVFLATRIENTATRERNITWAGAGGQYSVLAAPPKRDADGDVVMN